MLFFRSQLSSSRAVNEIAVCHLVGFDMLVILWKR